MDSSDHVDVYPDAVIRAGHHTAETAGMWQTWSTRIRMVVDHTDQAVHSTHISSALDIFAEQVVPGATMVSQQVADLGLDTSAAGALMANGDLEAATTLHQQDGVAAGQASLLSRPVNSESAAVV